MRLVDRPEAAIERPVPAELGLCLVIRDFLAPAECAELIARAEQRGFRSAESDYPPSYRNNERQVDDDAAFARNLFERLAQRVPASIDVCDENGCASRWNLFALNERMRWCRYRAGQRFAIHQDGVHHRGPDCRSQLTCMIYLSGAEAFDGGDTLFYADGPRAGEPSGAPPVVFDHRIWHAGDTVTRGVKHILRSDLLYCRSAQRPVASPRAFQPGHEGYVWTLLKLADGRVASAGRDASIRLWSATGERCGELRGHRQSILGLCEIAPGVLASVSRDRSVRLWDAATGTCLRAIEDHAAALLSIAGAGDGTFATGCADSTIRVRDASGAPLRTLAGHTGWVWALAPLGPGLLASASEDGAVKLWNAQHGTCIAAIEGALPLRTIDTQPAVAPGRGALLAAGDMAGGVRVWSLERTALTLVAHFAAHDAAVRRVRFLSSGRIATCGEDRRLRVWRLSDGCLLLERARPNFVTDVAELDAGHLLCAGYEGGLALQVDAHSSILSESGLGESP
jgi:WD40 repeat protein